MAHTAYVFVYLPAATRPIVAGRFDLEIESTPNVGRFVYAESYLNNPHAVPLDPIALPLKAELFSTTLTRGFFGVFLDAIPDAWGKHVAAKLYGEAFQTEFDYLFLPTGDRIGALTFGKSAQAPVAEREPIQWETLRDSALLEAIEKIDSDIPLTAIEERAAIALGAGTSAGGARPKMTVHLDNAVWLAKLRKQDDPWNVVRVEAATLDLATLCGIRVPDHRLERIGSRDLLLVKRFDRAITDKGVSRHRVVSAETVFRANEALARYTFTGSYLRFSRELTQWTITGEEDRQELFRRVVFNCLASVTDDHERNHALVAAGHHFRLSPAFDLTPQPVTTQRRYLAMAIGDQGAIVTRENLVSGAEAFSLSVAQANRVIDDVKNTIASEWQRRCKERGVSDEDIAKIVRCFDVGSFED